MHNKIIVILAILLGEIAMIFTEILSAYLYQINDGFFFSTFLKLIVAITVGAWILLGGYALGLVAFGNIWIVSAISITSILIFEPILAYIITGQLPTAGALIGFAFGATGLLVTLFL